MKGGEQFPPLSPEVIEEQLAYERRVIDPRRLDRGVEVQGPSCLVIALAVLSLPLIVWLTWTGRLVG